jgi:hypothetical protein
MPRELSESQAWGVVRVLANEILDAAVAGDMQAVMMAARDLRERVKPMESQLRAGIHVNPSLIVFGNPGRMISKNVMAIVYRHTKDDNLYVHGFGDADIDPYEEDGALVIDGLKTTTGVGMRALPNGSVKVFGLRGQRVWADV